MIGHTHKNWLILAVPLFLIAASLALAGQATADVSAQAQTKTLARNLEPVIVKGSQVMALNNAPVGSLYVYKFNGDTLDTNPIPAQVDEVISGAYTTTEDSLLDEDDEIVFMAKDLGDKPADPSVLTGTLNITSDWYEIEVTDPLSATRKGWAYLVRRNTPATISADYVDYNAGSITTNPNNYELGLSSSHVGLDELKLNGSSIDLLDRTKLRAVFTFLGAPLPALTEEDLQNPTTVEVKDGRVRVILRQSVTADPGGPVSQASLSATDLAYLSLVQVNANISFTLPGSVRLISARSSVDLSSAASGSTFYNSNLPGGVLIDGNPDTVAATPLSNWGQVSTTTGRIIQVIDPTPVGGTPKNYYCDNKAAGTTECDATPRTGDLVSYGDAGIQVEGSLNSAFTIRSSFFVLPPLAGGQGNVGATYKDYFFNPLQVVAYRQAVRWPMFLPIILKNKAG